MSELCCILQMPSAIGCNLCTAEKLPRLAVNRACMLRWQNSMVFPLSWLDLQPDAIPRHISDERGMQQAPATMPFRVQSEGEFLCQTNQRQDALLHGEPAAASQSTHCNNHCLSKKASLTQVYKAKCYVSTMNAVQCLNNKSYLNCLTEAATR